MKKRDFLDLVLARKTIYDFSPKQIRKTQLNRILEAGRWAPSSHNNQNWTFIVIKNKDTILRLLDICYYGGFYNPPPLLVAIINEPIYEQLNGLLKHHAKTYAQYHQYLNIGMPAITMIYEAVSLGLGTCILSPERKKAARILRVPSNKEVVLLIGIGHASKKSYYKKRTRKMLAELVRFETYGN